MQKTPDTPPLALKYGLFAIILHLYFFFIIPTAIRDGLSDIEQNDQPSFASKLSSQMDGSLNSGMLWLSILLSTLSNIYNNLSNTYL